MKKNIWLGKKGFTLLELLLAFAIFVIFMPAFISFTRTAISNNNNIQNQTNATNQLKNAFNYISQDGQMSGLVNVTNPSNFPLTLGWISYPSDTIAVVYTILANGNLQRVYTDTDASGNVVAAATTIVATNVNADGAKTYCTWVSDNPGVDSKQLTVNLNVTIGNVSESRKFTVTPRVAPISAQLTSTMSLTSTAGSINYGNTVSFTASFTQPVQSGTVTFLDSNSPVSLGTSPVLSTHTAVLNIATLAPGNHTISAIYSGDATYASTTSTNTKAIQVNQGGTGTAFTSGSAYCKLGDSVSFSAAVSVNTGGTGTPTGTITFTSDIPGDNMNIPVILVSGAASTPSIILSSVTGVHNITATYSGDSDFSGSSGHWGITVQDLDPVISNISPTSCNANPAADITLTVYGSNFANFTSDSSTIYFNGTALTTTFVSNIQLTAVISKTNSLLTSANNIPVTVKTPFAANQSNAKNFLVIGAPSPAQCTLTVTPSPANNILADGVTAATLTVTAIDSSGNNCGVGGATVLFSCTSGTCTLSGVTDNGLGSYTATVSSTTIGTCTFTATINGGNVGGGTSVQVKFVVGNTITVTTSKNWSSLTGGTGVGGKPSSADLIIVGNAATLTVDVNTAVANTITLGNGTGTSYTGNLTFSASSQLVVGTLTVNSNKTCNVTMPGSGASPILAISNQMTTGLTLTPGIGSINFIGAGSQTLPSDISTYNNLSTVGSVSLAVGANTTINGTLTVSDGTSLNMGAYTVTVTGTTTVGGGTSGTLTISSATGPKTFGGLVTVNSGATWNNSANEAVTFKGGITCNGTFTAGSGVQTFSTNAQALGGNLSIPSVTVTTIILTNNGTCTVTSALAGTGTFLNAATGTLNLNFSGAVGISTLNASAVGNTVNYSYSGTQTVKAITYYNLTLSGSGVKTIGTALNGTLTTGTFSIAPTGTATASITNKNIAVYTLVIAGSTKSVGTWGYGPANPPANRDTTHFANTTGYVTSSH